MTLALAACDQSPIFYSISLEQARKTAAIRGTPSRIVAFSEQLWVANGELFRKEPSGSWQRVTVSAAEDFGKIRDIVVANNGLYILTLAVEKLASRLYHSIDGQSWAGLDAPSGTMIDSLFSAGPDGGFLFVGAQAADEYRIYSYDGSNFLKLLTGSNLDSALVGAVYVNDEYYLATTKAGIYSRKNPSPSFTIAEAPSEASWSSCELTGLIAVGQDLLAVGRSRKIVYKAAIDNDFKVISQSLIFTGGLGLWSTTSGGTPALVLIGIEDRDNGLYGYRELSLTEAGELPGSFNLNKPGSQAGSSVSNNDSFNASLGKVPVQHLYQDSDGRLYASTQLQGLWSYVDGSWNVED